MSSRGETREQPSIPDSRPAPLCIEHVSLAVAVVALTIALGALIVEAATHINLLLRGGYSILAALIVVGFVGFVGKLVLRELAALKAGQLEVREATRVGRPTSSCRLTGHMYVSGTRPGDTVAVPAAGVDAATDPSGLTLQRAREDGIEQGFDIGYKAHLAELGIPSLPRPRQRRLTGDS